MVASKTRSLTVTVTVTVTGILRVAPQAMSEEASTLLGDAGVLIAM